jgi:hypothetical protein
MRGEHATPGWLGAGSRRSQWDPASDRWEPGVAGHLWTHCEEARNLNLSCSFRECKLSGLAACRGLFGEVEYVADAEEGLVGVAGVAVVE